MTSDSVVGAEMLAVLELVDGPAIGALGLAALGHVQVDLGVAVPDLHVGQRAGAIHAALSIQVFGQQFNGELAHGVLSGGGSDLAEPVRVFRVAAVDDVKEGALDFFGDRAAAAGAEFDAVQFADRRHLCSGAGEKGLVADVDLVAGDALLYYFQPQVFADVEHGVAGDAVERAG